MPLLGDTLRWLPLNRCSISLLLLDLSMKSGCIVIASQILRERVLTACSLPSLQHLCMVPTNTLHLNWCHPQGVCLSGTSTSDMCAAVIKNWNNSWYPLNLLTCTSNCTQWHGILHFLRKSEKLAMLSHFALLGGVSFSTFLRGAAFFAFLPFCPTTHFLPSTPFFPMSPFFHCFPSLYLSLA